MFHQSPCHRIAVHVLQLLSFFRVRVNVEVIKARLPECARACRWLRKRQTQLFLTNVPALPPHLLRDALLQHLQHRRGRAFLRLADQQMHMLWHHHMSHQQKSVLLANPSKFPYEQLPRAHRLEQRQPPITTESDKMQMTATVEALQPFGHGKPRVSETPRPTLPPRGWGTQPL